MNPLDLEMPVPSRKTRYGTVPYETVLHVALLAGLVGGARFAVGTFFYFYTEIEPLSGKSQSTYSDARRATGALSVPHRAKMSALTALPQAA